jgi:hypothetical protein
VHSTTDSVGSPTWKGHPLPIAGYEIETRRLTSSGTRTERFVANSVETEEDGRYLHLLALTTPPMAVALDARCLLDRWEYTTAARRAISAARQAHDAVDTLITAVDRIEAGQADGVDALAARDHDTVAATDDTDLKVAEVRPFGARSSTSTIDLDLLRRLDMLKQEKRRNTAEAEDISGQVAKIEKLLIEQMVESGQVDGVPFDDRKATLRTDVWGKRLDDVTEVEYYAAFHAAGPDWAALVQPRVNAQTLRSMLAEWESDHGELPDSLPEPLRAVLTTSEKYSITFSKGATTRATRRLRRTAQDDTSATA